MTCDGVVMFCIICALLRCLGDQRQWYSLPLRTPLTLLAVPMQYPQSSLLLKYHLLNLNVHAKCTRSIKQTVLTSGGAAQIECVEKISWAMIGLHDTDVWLVTLPASNEGKLLWPQQIQAHNNKTSLSDGL